MIKIKYFLAFIVLIVFTNCNSNNAEVNNDRQLDKPEIKELPTVEVSNPSFQSFNSEQLVTGTLVPDKMVYLHAMEKGMIKEVMVDIGDEVKKGQVLARLSNPLLNYEFKLAESKLLQEQSGLMAAKAKLELETANNVAAQNIYNRLKSVYDESSGLTTLMDLENAKRDADVSMAEMNMAKANVDISSAELKSAELILRSIKERLSMLSIRAPFSGIVSGRFVDPGMMIQNALEDRDAKPIVSIESVSTLRLILPIPESDVSGIQIGDKLSVELPSLPGDDLDLEVSRIAKSLDPASKTMEIQVDIDNSDGKIRSGMYAKAHIVRSSSKKLLCLPHSAINMRKDQAFVYLVSDGVVEELALKKGMVGKAYFEVLNTNITETSEVIVKGKSTVNSGQQVNSILKDN